jgi:uncharacterized protein YydD (DUF2326 family)
VAFPDKKIGIEINGNQHYNSDKTLKTYYQNRHDLIVADGWKLYELHYSFVFSKEIDNFILLLKNNFDYKFYIKKSKISYCNCGNKKHNYGKLCKKCQAIKSRKSKRPDIETLKKEIKEFGYVCVGKLYGVSDNAIRKWIKY